MSELEAGQAGLILVIDDEPDHRTVIRAILRRSGFDVVAVADAEAAFDALSAQRFDVALVDMRLAGRDGLSLMAGLRCVQPWLQVIIMTAYPSTASCQSALTAGAAAYLEKPFGPEALLSLITTLVDHDESPNV